MLENKFCRGYQVHSWTFTFSVQSGKVTKKLWQSHCRQSYWHSNIVIENTDFRTDENLYELSRGTLIVDIMTALNSLVVVTSSCIYEEFVRVFLEYLSKEFGGVELIADSDS